MVSEKNKLVNQALAPSLLKLAASLLYEALVMTALMLIGTAVFMFIFGDATLGIKRYFLQLFLWLMLGVYFVLCWQKSGQTLAMQAWRLKLVSCDDCHAVTLGVAVTRYLAATLSFLVLGLGFLWAIVDRDRLYLHDRMLKNKLICVPRKSAS